jgi:hypothetical protein
MRIFGRRRQRGQSLVEFTIIVPIIMVMAFTIIEFGVAFGTNMSMVEATSAASRVGAILVNGTNSLGCPGYTGDANVDPQIIAAVQRVVESPGSGMTLANIVSVHIYESNASGGEVPGAVNVWTPLAGGGPTVCGVKLDFVQGAIGWPAASRVSTSPALSIGVSIQYQYQLITPISVLTGLFGGNKITMFDSTETALEPSK